LYLTIIIPVYNEARTIAVTLDRVRKTVMPDFVEQAEIIIVDDCSTDGSAELAKKLSAGDPEVKVIRMSVNSGKGAAVAAGVTEAAGDTILIQDADLELDPADIPALLRKMQDSNHDLVSGTRFSHGERYPGHATPAVTLNRVISFVAARITGRKISDLTCGYKLIRKELFGKLNLLENGFGFETELMFKALANRKVSFAEERVSYSPRQKSEGKKIRAGDGLGIAAKLFRYGMTGKMWLSGMSIMLLIIFMAGIMLKEKHWNDERRVIEWDAISYYAYLPAAFIYHDLSLSFADNYQGPHKFIVWPERGPQGKYVIKTTMGLSIIWTPFFAAGHAAAVISGADTGGYSPPYKFFLQVSALLFLTFGLICLRKIMLKHASDMITAIIIAGFVLGTNLFWYTLFQGTMSHVYSFALANAFIWYSMKWHGGNSTNPVHSVLPAVRLGLLLGLITLIRPTNILIVLFFLFYKVNSADTLRIRIYELASGYRYILIIMIAAALVWVPQMIYWEAMTGHWLYFSYGGDERFFFSDPAIISGLFSWRKGLFIYTPLMIFSFAGIIALWYRRSPHALPVTIFVPLNIYIIFSWWCWWYGGGFGQRAFIDSYGLMAVSAASLLAVAFTTARKWFGSLLLALFLILASSGIMYNIQYYNGAIHWDSMTKEAYFDSFGKLKPSARFNDLLEAPDYEKAKEGLDR
jgi:glycosyltransferase involved in cell wall biosynthesis